MAQAGKAHGLTKGKDRGCGLIFGKARARWVLLANSGDLDRI